MAVESASKRAMDEKLAKVWKAPSAIDQSSDGTTVYKSTISAERLDGLKQEQQEAVERVFRSLRS